MIYFITGNRGKLKEAQSILGDVELFDVDLPEIQEVDPIKIIKAKLIEGLKHKSGEFIVEDTSLYFEELNGLPGPLIKWFFKTIGNDGLFNIADKIGNNRAQAKTIIGYARDKDNIEYFEGVIDGEIVEPRGDKDFGWGPIFKPRGHERTFGEMDRDEKNSLSMRKIALEKLKQARG